MPEGNDMSKLLIRSILLIFFAMGLAACGGSTSSGLPGQDSQGTDSSGDTSGDTDTGADTVKLGAYSGLSFTEGSLDIGVANLSAGGSTSVSAFLVDGNDIPLADGAVTQVTFTSTCTAQGTATITSPVEVESGRATATYTASGCVGTDTITARATTDSGNLSASGTITVAGASVGSIAFVSASPEIIALAGTGGAGRSETSTIKFKVLNSVGGAVPGETVEFSLNTTVGGINLSPATATTDTNGIAQTIVSSGSVPTAVRVTATVEDTTISTQSDKLTVSSGVPDQDSFSVSVSTLNPEAWDHDGETVTITARLADHFNNPVPDGTAVTFIAEGGSIDGSCFTTNGACSTTWTSQDPRPINGRATILIYAIGEESFTDVNGSGRFDQYDSDNDGTPDTLEPFTDLSEAWRDDDEDNCRDDIVYGNTTCNSGLTDFTEEFIDFGGNADGSPNGIFDTPNATDVNGIPDGDGFFNGVLCNDDSCSDKPGSIHVRESVVLVMSGSDPVLTITEPAAGCIQISDADPTASVIFTITDERLQQMPDGTTVSISSTIADTILLDGFSTWASSNSTAIATFEAEVAKTIGDDPASGHFQITIKTPKGSEVTFSRCITQS